MPSRRNRREVDRLVDMVEQMREVLDGLSRPVLDDLVRRAEQKPQPDGYPTSSRANAGSGGDGDPVLRVVMLRELSRRDVIGETIAEIVGSLHEAKNLLKVVEKRRNALVHAGALVRDSQSSVTSTCECCGRTVKGDGEDRLKSGFGPCCYKAWTRWRKDEIAAGREPSKTRFEAWHKSHHAQPQRQAVGARALDGSMRFVEPADVDDLRALRVLPSPRVPSVPSIHQDEATARYPRG